jgi:hypothetical protein
MVHTQTNIPNPKAWSKPKPHQISVMVYTQTTKHKNAVTLTHFLTHLHSMHCLITLTEGKLAGMGWTVKWSHHSYGDTGVSRHAQTYANTHTQTQTQTTHKVSKKCISSKILTHLILRSLFLSSELKDFDGFIVSHSPVFCRLFEVKTHKKYAGSQQRQ